MLSPGGQKEEKGIQALNKLRGGYGIKVLFITKRLKANMFPVHPLVFIIQVLMKTSWVKRLLIVFCNE